MKGKHDKGRDMVLNTAAAGALIAGRRTIKGDGMQSVEITRATVAAGKRRAVGEIVPLTDNDARLLFSLGKAVPVADAPQPVDREAEQAAKISKRAPKGKE